MKQLMTMNERTEPARSAALRDTGSGINWQMIARRSLNASAISWFSTMLVGQWLFVAYVIVAYGGAMIGNGMAGWNEIASDVHIAGDTTGNAAVAAHLLLAIIIIGGGPLQLIPAVRRRAPTFHRWNGRLYMVAIFITSLAGLYLIWTRDIPGGGIMQIGITVDAILILLFGGLALRDAIRRDLVTHRRWALRMFMAVSAVWFFRIGLMFWLAINGGPVGIDMATFTGPFLTFWTFGQYLLPLLILEMYFRARDHAAVAGKLSMAVFLFVVTAMMGFAIFVTAMGMWLPRM